MQHDPSEETPSPIKISGLDGARPITVPFTSLATASRARIIELKVVLTADKELHPVDLLIVQDGKELKDHEEVIQIKISRRPVFALVRSTIHVPTMIQVRVGSTSKKEDLSTALVAANCRIEDFKEHLYSLGLVAFAPRQQKLISEGRVLHNSSLVGDYILFSRRSSQQATHPQIMAMKTTLPNTTQLDNVTPTNVVLAGSSLSQLFQQSRRAKRGSLVQAKSKSCTSRFKGLQRKASGNSARVSEVVGRLVDRLSSSFVCSPPQPRSKC